MIQLVITLAVAFAGGLTAIRFKIPAGGMMGAMVMVALLNIFTGIAYFPQDARVVTQIAAGALIGSGITYGDFIGMRRIIGPLVILVPGLIVMSVLMAFMLNRTTELDIVTALFACAPGGMVDMSLISYDMGADTSKVAILQLIRIVSVISIFPIVLKLLCHRYNGNKEAAAVSCAELDDGLKTREEAPDNTAAPKNKTAGLMYTVVVSTAGGTLGYFLGIPAGAMTFSMLATALLNVITGKGYMPKKLRRVTQACAGALIGGRMTMESVIGLKSILLPALLLIAGFMLLNLLLGFIISRLCKLDIATSLSSAPGGMSDMALISQDMGADAPKVAVLQLTRLVSIIAFFPIIIKTLLG